MTNLKISLLGIHISRYSIVGITNLLLTTSIFYLLLKIFYINYLVSLSLMWIVGLFFTYTFNFIWTFKPEKKLNYKLRLAKYLGVYIFSFTINYLLMKYLVSKLDIEPFKAQLIIIPIVVSINFIGIRHWALATNSISKKL
jgi:putative flippase GtrA